MSFNVLVTGMGGQGCVTFGRVLATAASLAGWRVAGSEKRGGAQRGGAAEVMLRLLPPDGLPEAAYAAVIPPGQLDLLVGLEPLEAWRRVGLTSARTLAVVDATPVEPALSRGLGFTVPPLPEILAGVASGGARVTVLDLATTARVNWGKEAIANLLALAWLAEGKHLPFDGGYVRSAVTAVLGDRPDHAAIWATGAALQAP
ncbi:MAG: indolepyruvate ferredoxin oxidoreductase, beta subunit [Cyanobacteria bacterium RYN_339]|nr:indolepyruvate ferredoxin oxidoreductase, beta subunit [Cyanobacteria bacterium RYN_339]